MNFWKRRNKNPDLELVGQLKGVNIYQKKNLFELPSDRAFACLREAYYVNNWSASKEEVQKYLNGLERSFNEQKYTDVATFIKLLKIKVGRQPQEDSLVALASKYFYLSGEPDSLQAKYVSEKTELFKDIENAGFFLDFALQALTNYKGFANSGSNKFLNEILEAIQESLEKNQPNNK